MLVFPAGRSVHSLLTSFSFAPEVSLLALLRMCVLHVFAGVGVGAGERQRERIMTVWRRRQTGEE